MINEYVTELKCEGNVTIPQSDSDQFLTACAQLELTVEITDACDYDGVSYERNDIVL